MTAVGDSELVAGGCVVPPPTPPPPASPSPSPGTSQRRGDLGAWLSISTNGTRRDCGDPPPSGVSSAARLRTHESAHDHSRDSGVAGGVVLAGDRVAREARAAGDGPRRLGVLGEAHGGLEDPLADLEFRPPPCVPDPEVGASIAEGRAARYGAHASLSSARAARRSTPGTPRGRRPRRRLAPLPAPPSNPRCRDTQRTAPSARGPPWRNRERRRRRDREAAPSAVPTNLPAPALNSVS